MLSEHVVYKGCLRPAMFFGIPMLPFMVVLGPLLALTVIVSFYLALFFPIAIITMRIMVAKDEGIFDIIYLNMLVSAKTFKSKYIKNRRSTLIIVSNI